MSALMAMMEEQRQLTLEQREQQKQLAEEQRDRLEKLALRQEGQIEQYVQQQRQQWEQISERQYQFLKDPVKSEAWFKVTQAKRSHLQSQLHNRFCDTAHMMDRSGAPQTLVVVKVNCSYKTELEEHQRKLCFLDHLQPLYSQLISCREDQPSAKRLRVQSDASALT